MMNAEFLTRPREFKESLLLVELLNIFMEFGVGYTN